MEATQAAQTIVGAGWEGSYRLECQRTESVRECNELLAWLRTAELPLDPSDGDLAAALARKFQTPFKYKGRYVNEAPLLHVVIFLEATATDEDLQGSVSRILELTGVDFIDSSGCSAYATGDHRVRMHALTVAAGLGNTQVMEALTNDLDADDLAKRLNSETMCTSDGQYFYTPIHDACFLGHSRMVQWLLEKKSDPAKKNVEGLSPLHLFTIAGVYAGEQADIKITTQMLVERHADLQLRGQYRSRWQTKKFTPLEMATQRDSNFPKECIFLLTPSYFLLSNAKQDSIMDGSEQRVASASSIISDLLALASRSPSAAKELALEIISTTPKGRFRMHLLEDVQNIEAVEMITQLLYLSPLAGANVLGTLLESPCMLDPTHYPIPIRTSLWGLFSNVPMRCTYKPDAVLGEDGLVHPAWMYETGLQRPQWHSDFLPKVDEAKDRKHVYDVKVSSLNVPDLLSTKLMKTLALTLDNDLEIFNTTPIQGLITCMWCEFSVLLHTVDALFLGVSIASLSAWGLTVGEDGSSFDRLFSNLNSTDITSDQVLNSPAVAPIYWPMLMGVLVSEVVAYASYVLSYVLMVYHKRPEATSVNRQYKGAFRLYNLFWDVMLSLEWVNPALLAWLLYSTAGFNGTTLDFFSQGLLALNVAARMGKVMRMLMVVNGCGQRIIAIYQSFVSGAMWWMMFILLLAFFSLVIVFLVLRQEHSVGWNVIYLYRSLIVGDGDGLDRFGLGDEEDAFDAAGDTKQAFWSACYGMTANIFFNVVIMNLIIAIYSDEYNNKATIAPLMFLRERAEVASRLMLKYHFLGNLFPFLKNPRDCGIMGLVWILTLLLAYIAPEYVTFSATAVSFAITRVMVFSCLCHRKYLPDPLMAHLFGSDKVRVVRAAQVAESTLEVIVAFSYEVDTEQLQSATILTTTKRPDSNPLPPVEVCKNNSEDPSGFECYRLIFTPVETNHDDIFQLSFEMAGLDEVTFGLSRFLWICHRDDCKESYWRASGGADKLEELQNTLDELASTENTIDDLIKALAAQAGIAPHG